MSVAAGPLRKVLHVVLDLNEGGLERVVANLVLESHARRWDASVLCLREPGRLAEELPAAKVHRAPAGSGTSLYLPSAIARTIEAVSPDVLHLHSGVWLKGAYAGRLAQVPRILFTDHGRPSPEPMSHRLADRLGAVATDAVVAVSEPLSEYLRAQLKISSRVVRVIPNGIRIPAPSNDRTEALVRAELGLPPDTPVVGTVGRLDPIKAFDFLIDAMAVVRQRWIGAAKPRLVIVGDGSERQSLTERVAALDLEGSVAFLGWRRDAQRLMEAFDVFVISSDSEGTSIALLEAMAAERAVVATRVGGTAAVVGDELSGQLVEPRDLEGLANRLVATLSDRQRRVELGTMGRRRVLATYSVAAMANAYESLYDELDAIR